MRRFNLSEWAITHRALVLFMIILIGAAGLYAYTRLGRAEDPSFTIKVMNVQVAWPGATAAELQTQVVDKIEKKLQELPFLDRVSSYSQPGVAFIQVTLSDTTPPRRVKELWYQVRKKVGDIRGDLPAGVIGPNFNDEFGDVYSALYMITADGMSPAQIKTLAEDIRQRLLRVPSVNKVDLIGVRPERIFIEFSHAKLATHRRHAATDLRQRCAAKCGGLRRIGRNVVRPRPSPGDRRLLRRRRDRGRAGAGRRTGVPPRRHRNGHTRLRRPAAVPAARRRQAGARPRRLDAGRRQHPDAWRTSQGGDEGDHRRASGRDRDHAGRQPAADRRRVGVGVPARPSSRRSASCCW